MATATELSDQLQELDWDLMMLEDQMAYIHEQLALLQGSSDCEAKEDALKDLNDQLKKLEETYADVQKKRKDLEEELKRSGYYDEEPERDYFDVGDSILDW
jgi:chromosome segregation ATPase